MCVFGTRDDCGYFLAGWGRQKIVTARTTINQACSVSIGPAGCVIQNESLRSSLEGFSHSACRQVRFDGFWVPVNPVVIAERAVNAAWAALTVKRRVGD